MDMYKVKAAPLIRFIKILLLGIDPDKESETSRFLHLEIEGYRIVGYILHPYMMVKAILPVEGAGDLTADLFVSADILKPLFEAVRQVKEIWVKIANKYVSFSMIVAQEADYLIEAALLKPQKYPSIKSIIQDVKPLASYELKATEFKKAVRAAKPAIEEEKIKVARFAHANVPWSDFKAAALMAENTFTLVVSERKGGENQDGALLSLVADDFSVVIPAYKSALEAQVEFVYRDGFGSFISF